MSYKSTLKPCCFSRIDVSSPAGPAPITIIVTNLANTIMVYKNGRFGKYFKVEDCEDPNKKPKYKIFIVWTAWVLLLVIVKKVNISL